MEQRLRGRVTLQQERKAEPARRFYTSGSYPGAYALFDEVWGATICPECCQVRGKLEIRASVLVVAGSAEGGPYDLLRHQLCRCEDRSTEERWPGKDFNTYLELCYCCGAEVIESGSKWSIFYCRACMKRVSDLNRAVGRWVFPIGRHTAMHGIGLGGKDLNDERLIERFWNATGGLFAAGDRLHEWRRSVVRENLGELGFLPGQEVPLADYHSIRRLCDGLHGQQG
jgi:hypothetical protein